MTASRESRLLTWLLYLYVALLPFFGYSFLNLGGRALLRPDWSIGGLMVLVFIARWLDRKVRIAQSPANKFVVLFLYVAALGLVNLFDASSAQFVDFATKGGQLLLVAALYFVVSSLPLDEDSLKTLFRVWALVAFVVALYGLYQIPARALGLPFSYLQMSNPTVAPGLSMKTRTMYRYVQPTSFLREPGWLASFLSGPLIIFGLLMLAGEEDLLPFRRKWLNWLVIGTVGLTALLAGSLGTYASLVITSLAILALPLNSAKVGRAKVIRLYLILAILFLLGGLMLLALDIDFMQATRVRLEALFQGSRDPLDMSRATSLPNRLVRAQAAIQVWMSRPVLGVGLNQMSFHTDVFPWAQSPWLQVLADQGLVGLLALFFLLWSLMQGLWRLSRQTGEESIWHAVSVGLLFVLILDVVDGLHTLNWTHPQRWFTMALANLVCVRVPVYLKARRARAGAPSSG